MEGDSLKRFFLNMLVYIYAQKLNFLKEVSYLYMCSSRENFLKSSASVYPTSCSPLQVYSPFSPLSWAPLPICPPPPAFLEIILFKPGITMSFMLLLPLERGPGREDFFFQCFTLLWGSVPLTKLPCDRAFSLWTEEPEKLSCPSKTPIVSAQCSRR